MPSIIVEFAEALSTINRPSAFFVAGTEQMLAPGLVVAGIGPIALPLLPVQAEQLIAAADRAPYGRGEDTLTDIAVRRTWQIGADRVGITGKHWAGTIKAIVARVAEGLGVDGPVEAELYKLLIYDQGSFFVPHRDTEKVSGMFATLVLALPSVSEGGELIVRHKDREARLGLHCEEPSEVAFAAFYADCVHEVLPVTQGYRLVLVYNLVRRGAGRLPTAPNYDDEQKALTALLKRWAEAPRPPGETEPEKLIYAMEHAYTPAELDFQTLKGADAGIAPVVVAAAQRAGCEVHLALITVEESGSAVQTGGPSRYRRDRYHDDDDEAEEDEFEIEEVIERRAFALNWRRPDGDPSPLMELPIMEEEFSPPVSFDDLEPDEEHFHEATGNEGASYERTYCRAALILWPRDRLLAVINQAGLDVTLPFLADLADRWAADGDSSTLEQARVLSEHMLAGWPWGDWYPRRDNELTASGRFLNLLRQLKDASRLEAFLTTLADRRGFDIGDGAAIADALLTLPPDGAAPLATRLIEGAATPALAACANLLARLSMSNPTLATGATQALVAVLPGGPARDSAAQAWRHGPGVGANSIVDLFTALGRIDTTLGSAAADHVLAWPATYDFDTVLIPAMGVLLGVPETVGQAVVQRLRDACVAHLDARIALPLEPPGDWRRDTTLGCHCKDCQALGVYLGDATQKVWVFAAAEPRRRHVESTIRNAVSDVDMATERRGSPHRLICTKNQASYDRRRVQRAKDLTERERLTGSSV
jgi:predicted 2-oxoglutarate/Fe(II)-dependent dioxygenase YbiX